LNAPSNVLNSKPLPPPFTVMEDLTELEQNKWKPGYIIALVVAGTMFAILLGVLCSKKRANSEVKPE